MSSGADLLLSLLLLYLEGEGTAAPQPKGVKGFQLPVDGYGKVFHCAMDFVGSVYAKLVHDKSVVC